LRQERRSSPIPIEAGTLYNEGTETITVDEYLCLTLLSQPAESETDFKSRLSTFWTQMLRQRPDEFEKVYAEEVQFEKRGDRLGRRYLVELGADEALCQELSAAGMSFEPVDSDDIYSKYEAAPPDWFWIEH
jgi:hypothetical protein